MFSIGVNVNIQITFITYATNVDISDALVTEKRKAQAEQMNKEAELERKLVSCMSFY